MEEDLYLAHPDCILVISPHGPLLPDAFTVNFAPQYESDLREFGDLATKLRFTGDMNLAYLIRHLAKEKPYRTTLISEPKLDHGVTVPLYYFTPHLPDITILPIGFSDLDLKTHVDFGYLLKEVISKTNQRVAVIASGDLSHALTTDAPAGFNKHGQEFDLKIQELLSSKNTTGLLQLDPQLITEASECGLRSILILMGVLRDVNFDCQTYAYEGPFGVGYLTANFVM